MESSIMPQSEPSFKRKTKKQLVNVLIWMNVAIAIYLLLCTANAYLLPKVNILGAILSFFWELGIFLIAFLVLFSAVFLIVQLVRKDFTRYGLFLTAVLINVFLLFIFPFLVR